MIFQLILYTLIAFRLSEMIVNDDGPFDVLMNARGWFNQAPFDNSLRRNISNALSCVHCTGIWVSAVLGVVYYFSNSVTVFDAVLFSLAMAGGQSLLSSRFGRKSS